jgi:hypothetical protein
MAITTRERLARAWRDTDLRHPGRMAVEGILAAAATYAVFQYNSEPHEAVAHVTAIIISIVVAAVAIPVCEFLWNYARAPLAIEIDEMRAHSTPPPPEAFYNRSVPLEEPSNSGRLPQHEPRSFVDETSATAIISRIGSFKWNERAAVVSASYVGRWVSWSGRISEIAADNGRTGGFYIFVFPTEKGTGTQYPTRLNLPESARHIVEPLQERDVIAFKGLIQAVSELSVTVQADPGSVVRVRDG